MIRSPRTWVSGLAGGKGPFANIARNTGWLLGSKGIGAILSLFYLAITTRTLGPEGFGIFSLVIAAAQFISRIVTFDSWQAVVKYGQAPLKDQQAGQLGLLIGSTLAIDILSAVVGLAIAAGLAFGLGPVLGWDQDIAWMGFGYAAVVLLAFRSSAVGVLRLLDQFAAAALAESMMPIVRMIGALTAWWLMPTPLGFLIAWAISEMTVSCTYWILACRHGRGRIGAVRPVSPRKAQRHFPGIVPFLLASNLNLTLLTLITNLPIFILGLFVGTAEAGYYRLAAQLGNAMTTFSQLMSRAIFSETTRSHVQAGGAGSHAELRRLIRQISAFTVVSASIIVLMLWLVGEWLLLLMSGPAYLPAYILLLLLGCAAAIEMAGVGFDPLLMTIDRQRLSVLVRIIEAVVLAALMLVLLPPFGAAGTALSVLIAAFAGFVMRAAAVRIYLR
ncbi:MAG: lipopolysaccharide biosynthesis protein [Sphingobium sp.]